MKKEILIDDNPKKYSILAKGERSLTFDADGISWSFKCLRVEEQRLLIEYDGRQHWVSWWNDDDGLNVLYKGRKVCLGSGKSQKKTSRKNNGDLKAPMPGKILSVLVKNGQDVKNGDPLVVMEAMKMEHTIRSNRDGVVAEVNCSVGQQVEGGRDLIKLKDEGQ